jgi:Amidase
LVNCVLLKHAFDFFKLPFGAIAAHLNANYNTADLPTTGGSLSLERAQPGKDAFAVARLRSAGAIVLAKTNMHEFALSGTTVSSLGGQTLNPYDLMRTPGGSSGGTAAAVATNLAMAGTGSDTVNSIRSPASANALVGRAANPQASQPQRHHAGLQHAGRNRSSCPPRLSSRSSCAS